MFFGYVKDLRKTFNIPDTYNDDDMVIKYGRSCDLCRRLKELDNNFIIEIELRIINTNSGEIVKNLLDNNIKIKTALRCLENKIFTVDIYLPSEKTINILNE